MWILPTLFAVFRSAFRSRVAAKGIEATRRFRAWRPQIGTQKAAWAVAHYQLRAVWKVLHDGVHYMEPETELLNRRSAVARAKRALTNLRKLGYAVSITPPPAGLSM